MPRRMPRTRAPACRGTTAAHTVEILTATALSLLLFREHPGAIAVTGVLLLAALAWLTIARE